MNLRNGKIAHLPRSIRDLLNERLDRSQPASQILPWLNALEEVQETIKDDFDGAPISEQNLSQWRQGGFQEWLVRRDLLPSPDRQRPRPSLPPPPPFLILTCPP
jgi:hypothetical protein